MKKLKKLLLFILISFSFGIGIVNVKALDKDKLSQGNTLYFEWTHGTCSGKVSYNGKCYQHNEYWVNTSASSGDGWEKAYCIDARKNNNVYGAKVPIREMIDFSSGSYGAPYYGLYMLLANGGTSRNGNKANILLATDIALRGYVGANITSARNPDVKDIAVVNYYNSVTTGQSKTPTLTFQDSSLKAMVDDLIKKANSAKEEYTKNNGIKNVKVSFNSSSSVSGNTETITATFKITDASEDATVKISRSDITCSNCAAAHIQMKEVSINGEPLNGTVDLAKLGGDVKLTIVLERDSDFSPENEEDCEHAVINISYEIYDPLLSFSVGQAWDGTSANQRYWFVVPTDGKNVQNKSINSKLGCEKEPCDTELVPPVCSAEADGIGSVKAPEDIKKCIIGNKDDAGNSYKLEENVGGVNNDYCETFCKEDYREIVLNREIDDLNCGGYFKLKAKVEGSMDCYRGKDGTEDKSIDVDKYLEDIINVQKEFIENYDLYQKAQAAQGTSVNYHKYCKDQQCREYDEYWDLSTSYSGMEVANVNTKTGEVSSRAASHTASYYSESSEADIRAQIASDLSKAQSTLTSAKTRYENMIKNYNACTTEWENEFKFETKIGWEYDIKQHMDLLSQNDKYLELISGNTRPAGELEACKEKVDAKFETCSTGWTSPESLMENRNYTICTTAGCNNDNKDISTARFIKQHFEGVNEYLTPTVFYQVTSSGPLSGTIVSKSYTGPNIQTVPVGEPDGSGHGLPLASDSYGGGVFKLKIEDLGEFYDNGDLGRLIDFEGENESKSVAAAKGMSGSDGWNGEYVCHYYTKCTDSELCPECEFECVGEYCSWRECSSCDFECVNCIFNNDELVLNFKSVSTSGGFNESSGREYGYNWNVNTTLSELQLVREKAEEAIKDIEESNTTIYDNSDPEDPDSKLEFSIVLTPDTIQEIRDYNKKQGDEQSGGYGNATLTCYDYEAENKAVYKNVFCYSEFIDDLVKNHGDSIYIKNRGDLNGRNSESVVNSGYWTPWEGYEYNNSVIGGPAYK